MRTRSANVQLCSVITRVRLRNFKSFTDQTFALEPFTLVYGSNAAGKSNFVDALRFLQAVGDGRSVRDAIEGHTVSLGGPTTTLVSGIRGGAAHLINFMSEDRSFRLDVDMETDLGGMAYSITVDVEEYKVRHEELRAKRFAGQYVFTTDPDVAPPKQARDSPALLARYYKSSPGRNPSRSFSAYEPILCQFVGRKAETVYNERYATAARSNLKALSPLELRPEVLRQYSALGRFDLGEHGENFAAVTWALLISAGVNPETVGGDHGEPEDEGQEHARARLGAIRSWLQELTPRSVRGLAVEFAPTNEVIFSLQEDPYSRLLNARSLSDGTLRFAALAIALLGAETPKSFVIEELENGINPARLELLVRMIEAATQTHLRKQVIATTHAPGILDIAGEQLRRGILVMGWDSQSN